jgi:FXSXX-COOH protein
MDSRPDLLCHQIDLTGIPLSALRDFRGPELSEAIARMLSNARSCALGDTVQEQRV